MAVEDRAQGSTKIFPRAPCRQHAGPQRALCAEEYVKLRQASNRDEHDDSKQTTLPIAREIVKGCIAEEIKPPWYIDLNVAMPLSTSLAGE